MKKKDNNPSYTVNLDDIERLSDIDAAFAIAKHNANIPLTDEELKEIVWWAIEEFGTKVCFVHWYYPFRQKKPWYKRFWSWISRKKD